MANWMLKAVISANSESMIKALKNVNAMSRTTRKHLMDIGSSATNLSGKIGLPFAAIAAAAGGLSMVAVKNAVVGFTQSAEEIKKGSLKAGMSAEDWQRLAYAGEQAGVGVDTLQSSMAKLNLNMGNAASGQNKDLAGLMKKLGISMLDANGNVRSTKDLLPELSDAFVRNGNAAVRARMGTALFGKAYGDMLPLLTEGGAALKKNERDLERIKGVVTAADIDAAKDLGDQFSKLNLVSASLRQTVATGLMPEIRALTDATVEWWVANKPFVAGEVAKAAKMLGDYIKTIDVSRVARDVSSFVDSGGKFIDMVGGAKNALIGLIAFMNLSSIAAGVQLVGALARGGFALAGFALSAYKSGNAAILSLFKVAAAARTTSTGMWAMGLPFMSMGKMAVTGSAIAVGGLNLVKGAARGLFAVLRANPLGVILSLAEAAYLVYENWDTLKKWFGQFFDWMGKKFEGIVDWASKLADSVGKIFEGSGSAAGAYNTDAMGNALGPQNDGASLSGSPSVSLIAPAGKVNASGQIEVVFKDAPAGMRVEPVARRGNVPINTSVGYRSFALGTQ